MTEYNFCPKCGGKISPESEPPHCQACNITYYRNAKPTASVLLVKDGQVLLAKRGIDPYKGAYDIIGGFMEEDELPEQAAIREAKEETGLDIKITSLLGIYNDVYGEGGDHTLNLHYIGTIIDGEMTAMDDVESLEWVDIDKVPLEEGFQNTRESLRDLRQLYVNGKLS